MTIFQSQYSLQSVLRLDAAACLIVGGGLILLSGQVAHLTQLSPQLLFWAGLLLIPVAGFMATFAVASRVPNWAVFIVVAGNGFWVLASLALPLTGLVTPNALGWALLLTQALAVAFLANLEWQASRSREVTV